MTYTDIYKIKSIAVKTEKSQGFKDGDNWDRQIKACLVNDTVDEIADKIKNKHSEDGTYDEKEVYKKLDDADSYETGKYKEKYADKNEKGRTYMGKCKGRSRMERFLEKYIFLSNSGISSK